MKFFKKGSANLIAGMMLLSCTACSGLDKLADGLKNDGKGTSDNTDFLATYDADYDGIIRITVE